MFLKLNGSELKIEAPKKKTTVRKILFSPCSVTDRILDAECEWNASIL